MTQARPLAVLQRLAIGAVIQPFQCKTVVICLRRGEQGQPWSD